MDQKKAILIGFVALAILAFFIIADYKNKGGFGGATANQNILYITQPVYSFSGVVDKIEGNVITVSQKQLLIQSETTAKVPATAKTPSLFPTPKTVMITYRVTLTNDTQISRSEPNTPYLYKAVVPAVQSKLSIKDVKVGDYVSLYNQKDLRTLIGNTFEASMLSLPQKMNVLNGRIVGIEGNTLAIKAFSPASMSAYADPTVGGTTAPMPKEKDYLINLTSNTEISRYTYSASPATAAVPPQPKTEQMTPTDLKKDMQITVYTDEDVTQGSTFTALRIEPLVKIVSSITPTPMPLPVENTFASDAAQVVIPTP